MPVTVTRTTNFLFGPTGDVDGDGQYDPGDKILTTIELSNIGGPNAPNLVVYDDFAGSTVTSTKITPIAFDDDLGTIAGNTPMTFSLSQLLSNDLDPDNVGGPLILVGGVTNASHVSFTDNGDGTFTLVPETGYQGLASFEYTIQDAQGLGSVTTGHVTLTISGQVWYVDGSYAGANGTADGS